MGTFNLLSEHGYVDQNTADITVSPHWILMVIRFAEPLTASKARLAARTPYHTGNISFDDDIAALTKTKKPLIITGDCVRLDVDSSKDRYVANLQATLISGKRNYLSEILPGDWVFAWMMNSKEKYEDVVQRLRIGEACNRFDDGLKFMGRVHDIRKVLTQTPEGLRVLQYNLAGAGFSELDSSIFFDPNLSRNEQYIDRVLQNLSIPLKEIYSTAAEEAQKGAGGIDINKMMPALIKAFIGEGVSGLGVKAGDLPLAQGAAVATKEAPFAYVIPDGVASILGVTTPSKASGIYAYADILNLLQGLQKHEDHSFPKMFFPEAHPLKGVFLPTATSFDNKSLWNLLQEFLNPAINEMYTAMKYVPDDKGEGRIMPTLVVRQLPFSSPVLTAAQGSNVTSFHELPRWYLAPVLVRGMDIGRSDGERINFVHIYGQPAKNTLGTSMSEQLILYPPVSDIMDVKRHGLRPHMGLAAVSPVDIIHGGPAEWTTLRADFLMGQHLMLTGVCSMIGVTSPIVPGDNLEFEDALFHIEAVHHHCEISPQGVKSFTTQASLTHGVRNDLPAAIARIPPKKKATIKKKGYLRTDLLKAHAQYVDKDDPSELDSFGGLDTFNGARFELEAGFDLEVTESGGNPDLYLYSGVHEEDNVSVDPGSTDEELP